MICNASCTPRRPANNCGGTAPALLRNGIRARECTNQEQGGAGRDSCYLHGIYPGNLSSLGVPVSRAQLFSQLHAFTCKYPPHFCVNATVIQSGFLERLLAHRRTGSLQAPWEDRDLRSLAGHEPRGLSAGIAYFFPDNRSINDANFEPFLSICTRRWRTPVSLALSEVISSVLAPRISRV